MPKRSTTNVKAQLEVMRNRLKDFTSRDYADKDTNSGGYQLSFLFSGDLQELICKAFVANARRILASNPSSAQYAMNVSYVVNADGSCDIVVVDNEENIMTYLEYGTGLIGKANRHPEAGENGWNYAIHEYRYKLIKSTGNKGFIFKRQPNRYFNPDTDFMLTRRSRDERRNIVFSQGIKPLRYLYDSRRKIEIAYNRTKSLNAFIKKLESIEIGGK